MKKTFLEIHMLSYVIIILIKSRVEKRSRLVNRKWGGVFLTWLMRILDLKIDMVSFEEGF